MKYNIPIEAATLAYFYSRAAIMPMAYLPKSMHDNVQSLNPNVLLLTQHSGLQGATCYIVIDVTEQELQSERCVKWHDDTVFYRGAFPISRILEICFCSEPQLSMTAENIRMGDAFVPQRLLHVDSHMETVPTPICPIEIDKDSQLGEALKEYNRVLGALALLKLEAYPAMSVEFLRFAAYYNAAFSEALARLSLPEGKSFTAIFNPKWKKFLEMLRSRISYDSLTDYAKENDIRIYRDPIKGINFNAIGKDDVRTLALLQNFNVADAEGGTDKIDGLILNGFGYRGTIPADKTDSFAFYYGYNRGYAAFRCEYKLDRKRSEVKFHFESEFEKLLCEMIFSKVVNGMELTLKKPIDIKVTGDTVSIVDVKYGLKKKAKSLGQEPPAISSQDSGIGSSPAGMVSEETALYLLNELTTKADRKKVAKELGCRSRDDYSILKYLLKVPAERLRSMYARISEKAQKTKPKQKVAKERELFGNSSNEETPAEPQEALPVNTEPASEPTSEPATTIATDELHTELASATPTEPAEAPNAHIEGVDAERDVQIVDQQPEEDIVDPDPDQYEQEHPHNEE